MSVLIVQHHEDDGPGLLSEWLASKEKDVVVVKVPEQMVPDPAAYEAVIILGGPQSANDNEDYLRNERLMVRKALMLNKPLLGICLGAQIIAAAAGAKVKKSAVKEFGIQMVEKTHDAEQSIFTSFPKRFPVFQWHEETFDLPKDATQLVRGAAVSQQAFQYKSAVALQFHLEATESMVKAWIANNKEKLQEQHIEPHDILSEYHEHKEQLQQLFDSFCNSFFT